MSLLGALLDLLVSERRTRWATALAAALVVQALLTVLTFFMPARDLSFGGPLPVGRCHLDFIFSPANACTADPFALAANIGVTWAALGILGEVVGIRGVLLVTLVLLGVLRFPIREATGAIALVPNIVMGGLLLGAAGLAANRSVRTRLYALARERLRP